MERLYRVTFDTQRDRQSITWGLFVMAHNISEAKEKAFQMWNSDENPRYKLRNWRDDYPHMYHTRAERVNGCDKDLLTFFKIADRYASWGYRA